MEGHGKITAVAHDFDMDPLRRRAEHRITAVGIAVAAHGTVRLVLVRVGDHAGHAGVVHVQHKAALGEVFARVDLETKLNGLPAGGLVLLLDIKFGGIVLAEVFFQPEHAELAQTVRAEYAVRFAPASNPRRSPVGEEQFLTVESV